MKIDTSKLPDNRMNIYALEGYQVVVTEKSAQSGYQYDKDKVAELLEIGEVYEVAYTTVHSSSTDVKLRGFDCTFNSVNFVEVEPQCEADDMLHDDWAYYNR